MTGQCDHFQICEMHLQPPKKSKPHVFWRWPHMASHDIWMATNWLDVGGRHVLCPAPPSKPIWSHLIPVRSHTKTPDKKSCNPLKSEAGTLHVHAFSVDFMQSRRGTHDSRSVAAGSPHLPTDPHKPLQFFRVLSTSPTILPVVTF